MADKYRAQERAWVMRLLARLSPEQRARYEKACSEAPRHHNTGKLYDHAKAAIAERILYADALRELDGAA
jgi:hypothetical protein